MILNLAFFLAISTAISALQFHQLSLQSKSCGVSNQAFRRSSAVPKCLHMATPVSSTILATKSLIKADQMWALWTVIAFSASSGLKLEGTKVGKMFSGPVCSMLITAILTNCGVLPSAGSIHIKNLQSTVVKLATPLLLLSADMAKIFKETEGLLKAFFLGTFGTLFGSGLSYFIFRKSLSAFGRPGEDGWKLATALTSKNIGGGLNL